MSLTRLAFQNRTVTYLLITLLLALGGVGLFSMARREDPDIRGRFAQVIARYPGATAAQVEELVAERIERTLREVDDIGTVTTAARPSIAVFSVEAADRMTGSLDKMMDDIRERMADIGPSLPNGVTISVNDRFGDTSALILAVTRPGASPRELEDGAKALRDRLRLLPEVGEARLLGEQTETVTVSLSAQRMATLAGAVSIDGVTAAIARKNILPEVGGSIASGDARLTVVPTGDFANLTEIENLVVGTTEVSPVYLRDVATVTRGYADPASFLMRVNGQPAVGVSLSMRKGQNINVLGEKAKEVIAEVKPHLPPGTEVTTVNDLPRSVERRVEGFFHELQLAALIIFGIMFLFMGARSAALVGAMLPISMLGTFAAMWLTGRDIQQMSIAALIIALALVVDNSIVVLDNIEEKMTEGLALASPPPPTPPPADGGRGAETGAVLPLGMVPPSPRRPGEGLGVGGWRDGKFDPEAAALEGAEEIRGPLLTANLVAVTSFLPLAFLPGGVGDFIRDLGLVTSLSLLVSVLLNLTLLPLLCYHFLKPVQANPNPVQRWLNRGVDGLREGKASLAGISLRRPGLTVVIALVALTGSVSLIPRLGFSFFPPAERDQFVIDVWLPEGRDILATQRAVERVESLVQGQPGVRSYVAYVGQGGPRFYYNISPEAPAANYAQVVVNTDSIGRTEGLVAALQAEANATISEARVTVKKLEQGPPVGAPIAVRVTGPSVEELRRIGTEIKTLLNETPGTLTAYDSFAELPLRLSVKTDEDRAGLLGVSSGSLAGAARLALSGQTVSYFREGDKEIPIDLRLAADERANPEDVLDLYLPSANGPVQLRQVASLSLIPGEGRIVRRNGERTLTVSAFGDGSRLASAILADVQKRLKTLPLPDGYRITYGGESEESQKSFSNMGVVFGIASVVTVVLLTLQFGSFPTVAAILSSVPLGVIGAIPGLFLAHQTFGFMAFLGIAALGGVVTNHTIFMFFYAQLERRHGANMTDALVDAGRRRLRPILLTVLLSVGALLPQAFSGSKLWPPLDWALIAGLLVSTTLTIVVIPSVYALLQRSEGNPTPSQANSPSRRDDYSLSEQ